MASTTHERARVANAVRHHPDNHAAIAEARADLATEKMASWIKRNLDAAPPLGEARLSRLRALLVPAGGE